MLFLWTFFSLLTATSLREIIGNIYETSIYHAKVCWDRCWFLDEFSFILPCSASGNKSDIYRESVGGNELNSFYKTSMKDFRHCMHKSDWKKGFKKVFMSSIVSLFIPCKKPLIHAAFSQTKENIQSCKRRKRRTQLNLEG